MVTRKALLVAALSGVLALGSCGGPTATPEEFGLCDPGEETGRCPDPRDLAPEATIGYIPIKKLLIHQSGLQSNMPIAPYVFFKGGPVVDCQQYFCSERNDTFSIQIAENFYFNLIGIPTQIISSQIDQHHMLCIFFFIGTEYFGQLKIFFIISRASECSCNGFDIGLLFFNPFCIVSFALKSDAFCMLFETIFFDFAYSVIPAFSFSE